MKIYHEPSGREARPIQGKNDKVPVYKCFHQAGGNKDVDAVKFVLIDDAAKFLLSNSGSVIRVAACGVGKGQQTAIIRKQLKIET